MNTNNLGILLACEYHGVDPEELTKTASTRVDTLLDSPAYRAELVHSMETLYDLAGKSGHIDRHFLGVLNKQASLGAECAQDLQRAACEVLFEVLGDSEDFTKEAGVAAGLAAKLSRLGLSVTPALLKTMIYTGTAAGLGGGALAWGLNRHAKQDDADLEAMQARIDAYNRITHEISGKLRDRGVVPGEDFDPEDVRDLAGAQQVSVQGYNR